jgi:hypothetical protein
MGAITYSVWQFIAKGMQKGMKKKTKDMGEKSKNIIFKIGYEL